MRFKRGSVLLAGALWAGLAACTPTEPGLLTVDAKTAQALFQDICVQHAPGFGASERQAEAIGMSKSPRSGIMFHPSLNLSVRVSPKERGTCSMVFASPDSQRKLERALNVSEVADANGMRIRFSTYTEPNGTKYNSVVIEE